MDDHDFVEYGRQGARKRWSHDVVKLQDLDTDTRKAVRALLKLAESRKAQKADAA